MAFSLLPSIERARYCWLWLLIGHLPWEVWTCTRIDHCHLSCFFFPYFKLSQLVPTAKLLIILIYDKIQIQLLHVQISVCLEIETQSQNSENAQRNLEIAQIPRLRGTCTHNMVLVQS